MKHSLPDASAVSARYWASEEQAPGIWERTWPYDMWSLGVIFLELILGTPHVFDISPRTRVCQATVDLCPLHRTFMASSGDLLCNCRNG